MAGETMLYRADFAGARDSFATAVAEYDDRERTKFWAAHTSHNAGVTIRCNLAVSLWHLGYPDQALKVNREMCQLAREIGHPFSLAYALHHTGWLYQFCRLGAEVQTAAEEEIAIATEQGFALWHATGTFFKGAGMLLQGRAGGSAAVAPEGPRCLPGHRCRADSSRSSSASWATPTRRPAGSRTRTRRWTRAWPSRRRTTSAARRPSCTASRASCCWPSRPTRPPPPRTASARPSRRPGASRARHGSCGPR